MTATRNAKPEPELRTVALDVTADDVQLVVEELTRASLACQRAATRAAGELAREKGDRRASALRIANVLADADALATFARNLDDAYATPLDVPDDELGEGGDQGGDVLPDHLAAAAGAMLAARRAAVDEQRVDPPADTTDLGGEGSPTLVAVPTPSTEEPAMPPPVSPPPATEHRPGQVYALTPEQQLEALNDAAALDDAEGVRGESTEEPANATP